jgi:DNA-directed RNA polymerase subunit E'/Rpb7
MNIQNPYINTYLYANIGLHPSQFDNDIYKHLKTNLSRKLHGKCYRKYGYVSKIYKIDDRQGGEILADDPSSSALFKLKFSCKICKPLRGTIIICEIMAINKSIIHLRNGPINVLIFEKSGSINQTNFVFDDKKNVLLANVGDGQKTAVVVGTHVHIKVVASRIEHNSTKILIIGTLEDIASKEEIEESIKQRESDGSTYVNYDDYIDTEKIYNIQVEQKYISKTEYINENTDTELDDETNTGTDTELELESDDF